MPRIATQHSCSRLTMWLFVLKTQTFVQNDLRDTTPRSFTVR